MRTGAGTVAKDPEEMLELVEHLSMFDFEDQPDNKDLRDPGLHPKFQLYIANLMYGYLRQAPGRINALASAYQLVTHGGMNDLRRNAHFARAMFLDSGAISGLIATLNKRLDAETARAWLERGDDVLMMAYQLHEDGSPPGVVAAMDLPAYADLLGVVGLSIDDAEAITIRNSEQMLASEVPPGWRKVFTSQGISIDDHKRCMDAYERIGVLAEVRAGRAWLGVGGMAFEKGTGRVHDVHRMIRGAVGDVGHIHALGVSRLHALVPMIRKGLVNSADSSSPCQRIRYNQHKLYTVQGPRPTFLVEALHAVAALYAEARLAGDLARDTGPEYEQDGFFDAPTLTAGQVA